MRFIDTNIFIRHLTKDDPQKAQACYNLFKKAEANQIKLTTTEAVITEVVYVLSSKKLYDLSRKRIRQLLYPLLSLKGLSLPHKRMYLRALDLYATLTMDFEDTVIVAQMERQKLQELYSYDERFGRIPHLKRLEP
jgi:predicted nucleic acid-binding protein